VLIRGRGSSEPGIIRDGDQKICSILDESPTEVRKDDFKTDENPKFPLGEKKMNDPFSRFKVSNAFPYGGFNEEEKFSERNIFSKRDKMDLVILSYQFLRRRYQEGTIIVIDLSLLYFIKGGSKKKEGIRLFRNFEDDGLILLGFLKEEGGGRFRPDNEIRFILCNPH
jgi:hypothetical protein